MKFATKVTNSVSIITTVIPAINCTEVIKTITNASVNKGKFFWISLNCSMIPNCLIEKKYWQPISETIEKRKRID